MRTLALILAFAMCGAVRSAEPLTADALALRVLDGEALYTVTDGLKPISDGFWSSQFPASEDAPADVALARRLLASLPLGPDREAGVYVFQSSFQGKRSASAFVAHKPSLRSLVLRRRDVFEPIGITEHTNPQQVMEKIDRAPRAARWRAFGLVFGYPEYAVEFFVAAGEQQDKSGTFVEREFRHLPTFASDDGRFVYAVPKGHVERDEDRRLKTATAPTFERYKTWRAVYIGDDKAGAAALLRDWLAPPIVERPPALTPCCQPVAFSAPRHRLFRHRGR